MTPRLMTAFRLHVTHIEDVTPSFRRFSFTGDNAAEFGDTGWDQRIKVVFPTADLTLDAMPTGDDWYTAWRDLPEHRRLPFRTYTTRAVDPATGRIVVDMVSHGVSGPASAWIERARPGDEVLIFGPTTAAIGLRYGIDFIPPRDVGGHLLVGDETAAPAIAVMLEQLPPQARGIVVLEVPDDADIAYLPDHPGFDIRVGSRENCQRHDFLISETRQAAADLIPAGQGSAVTEIDVDSELLWEVPRSRKGTAALSSAPLYAWLAGEAGAIKSLRRFLVAEHGVDRRAVAFMGYWRLGRAEGE